MKLEKVEQCELLGMGTDEATLESCVANKRMLQSGLKRVISKFEEQPYSSRELTGVQNLNG